VPGSGVVGVGVGGRVVVEGVAVTVLGVVVVGAGGGGATIFFAQATTSHFRVAFAVTVNVDFGCALSQIKAVSGMASRHRYAVSALDGAQISVWIGVRYTAPLGEQYCPGAGAASALVEKTTPPPTSAPAVTRSTGTSARIGRIVDRTTRRRGPTQIYGSCPSSWAGELSAWENDLDDARRTVPCSRGLPVRYRASPIL
jgi:hypothetical protein